MSEFSHPSLDSIKRPYVAMMFGVMGRSLAAASQVDPVIQKEVRRLPKKFVFQMCALPLGPAMVMEKVGDHELRYIGCKAPANIDLSMKFKHIAHAFLVLSFQEGTARAYANDRILVDGDIGDTMKLVRCMNRMETMILPKFIAARAVKRYPNIAFMEKLATGGRIYSQFVKNLVVR